MGQGTKQGAGGAEVEVKRKFESKLFTVFCKMNPYEVDFDSGLGRLTKPKLHVRIQKRNGKKCITTVEGFEEDLDVKRICKYMRKKFNCNGNVVADEEQGDVIQLQGDQRENVKQWLLDNEVFEKQEAERIVVHGY